MKFCSFGQVKKIAIIQTAFLGDVVLMTPVIEELSRLYPQVQLDVIVRKGNESLLQHHPKIRQLMVWDKNTAKYKHLFQLLRKIRKERYDEVIGIQRFASTGLLTGCSKSPSRVGFLNNPLSWLFTRKVPHSFDHKQHETERNLLLIAHHEGVVLNAKPKLYPTTVDEEKIAPYIQQTYYCIAPSSVWFTKQVSLSKWSELIEHLGKQYILYLLGSSKDIETCDALKQLNPNFPIVNLAGKLSLLASAALMRSAKRNYVNDSGPLHLASAVNAPVSVFFCSTIPDFGFGPLSDDKQIIEIEEHLNCRPCGIHGHKKCPEGHFKCNHLLPISKTKV
jgi:heptosyltransferase-2